VGAGLLVTTRERDVEHPTHNKTAAIRAGHCKQWRCWLDSMERGSEQGGIWRWELTAGL
jgi:hypothetical protein